MLLTTTQAATEIARGLEVNGVQPSVFPDKVVTLCHANRLTSVSDTSRFMFDDSEIADFINTTRFVPDLDEVRRLHPEGLVYRTSVRPREARTHAYPVRGVSYKWIGVDLADNPTSSDELGGWCGVWRVNYQLAQDLAANQALVFASLRDYVGRGRMRTIIDIVQVGDRWFFVTQPAPLEVETWLGSGVWIDTPGGAPSALV